MADGAGIAGVARRAGPLADRIVFLGHSTVLIELDGVRLLTDPILRGRVVHLRRDTPPPDPSVFAAPDAVLISHLHQDHLDLPSLRLLGLHTPLIVPAGAGAWLRGRGFTAVSELSVGEETGVGTLTVRAVEARHDGGRPPRGPRGPALGFLVGGWRSRPHPIAGHRQAGEPGLSSSPASGSRVVYFAGDTELFADMANLSPAPDVALLPVAGWGSTLGPGHMDPLHAARAARLIQPRLAIPIHWGTLRPIGLNRHHRPQRADPPRLFAQHVAQLAPDVEVRVLDPGQATEL
jgi:L-ascorbate metabolism protein UlaG (beta-lactamase superfamily)